MGDIEVLVHTRNDEAIDFGPEGGDPQNYVKFLR